MVKCYSKLQVGPEEGIITRYLGVCSTQSEDKGIISQGGERGVLERGNTLPES